LVPTDRKFGLGGDELDGGSKRRGPGVSTMNAERQRRKPPSGVRGISAIERGADEAARLADVDDHRDHEC
jgi:hypothetical protein